MIFAVDFDGTLCDDQWPEIGKANHNLIHYLKIARLKGHKLILYTMREGSALDQALGWCEAMGLQWDAVNDNLPEMIERFGNNPRKIFADRYIDDRNAVNCGIGRKLPKM